MSSGGRLACYPDFCDNLSIVIYIYFFQQVR